MKVNIVDLHVGLLTCSLSFLWLIDKSSHMRISASREADSNEPLKAYHKFFMGRLAVNAFNAQARYQPKRHRTFRAGILELINGWLGGVPTSGNGSCALAVSASGGNALPATVPAPKARQDDNMCYLVGNAEQRPGISVGGAY